jgi:hypothetical protein
MRDWKDSVHLPGPKYIRRLGGSTGGTAPPARPGGTIAVVLQELGEVTAMALRQALEQALRTDADVYVVLVLSRHDGAAPPELLPLSTKIGDQLSTLVLRLGEGRLPELVNIVVYWGSPMDVASFVADSIQPALVTIVHRDEVQLMRRAAREVLSSPPAAGRKAESPN